MATTKRLSDLKKEEDSDFAKFRKRREQQEESAEASQLREVTPRVNVQQEYARKINENEKLNEMKSDTESDYAKFIRRRNQTQLKNTLDEKKSAQQAYLESDENVGFWDAMLPGGATPSEYKESRQKKKQYEKEVEEAAAQVAAYEQFWKQKEAEGKTSAEIDAYLAKTDKEIEKLEEEKGSFWEAMKPGGVKPSEYNANRKAKEAEIKKLESQQGTYRAIRDEKKSREMTDELPEDVKGLLDEYNSIGDLTQANQMAAVIAPESSMMYNSANNAQAERKKKIAEELVKKGYSNYAELAEYRQYVKDVESARAAEESIAEFAKEHPVASSAMSVAFSPAASIAGTIGTAENVFKDKKSDLGANPYDGWYYLDEYRNVTRQAVPETFEDGKLSAETKAFLYGSAMSAADSAVAGWTMGTLGGASLGMSALNDSYVNALKKGATQEQALATGVAAGAAEGIFEAVSLGYFVKGVKPTDVKGIVKNVLVQAGVNAQEEAATEVANMLTDYLINGGMSDYYQSYEYALSTGMSQEQAKQYAKDKSVNQVVESALSGALMGAGFGVIGSATGNINYNSALKDAGKQAVNEGKVDNVLAGASDIEGNEVVSDLIGKVEAGQSSDKLKGKDYKNIGKLMEQLDKVTGEDRSKLIEAAVKNRLTELGEADSVEKKTSAIVKVIENLVRSKEDAVRLTKAEKKAIRNGTYTQRVLNEITDVTGGYSSAWADTLDEGIDSLYKIRYEPDVEAYKAGKSSQTEGSSATEVTGNEGTTEQKRTASGKSEGEVLGLTEKDVFKAEENAKAQIKQALIQQGQDVEAFNAGFELYYEQGRSGGFDFTKVKENPNVSESFTEYQRQQAFEQGQHQRLKDVGNARYKGGTVAVFVNGYSGKDTVNRYAQAFDRFYAEGAHTKKSFEDVLKSEGHLFKVIDEGVARKAFEEGRKQPSPSELRSATSPEGRGKKAPKKAGSYRSKTIEEGDIDTFFEAFAGKLGMDVERVQRIAGGEYEVNAQVDLKSGKMVSSASSRNEYQSSIHESVHIGYAYGDKEKMAEIEETMKNYFVKLHGAPVFENVIRQYEQAYPDLDRAGVMEEFTADALAGVFSSEQGINEFVDWLQKDSGYSQAEKKTILEKLSEWLRDIIDKIRELVAEGHLNNVTEAYAKAQAEQFNDVRQKFLQVLDEIEGVEGADSTSIRFSKPIKNYPYNMQTVISDYIASVDIGLLNFINKAKNLSKEQFERYTICETTDKLIKDLKSVLGIDVSGYKNAINANAIHHIKKRHGVGGRADSSMENDNDIARMRYIIENYDNIEILRDKKGNVVYSNEFKNSDNTKVPLVKLSKRINGTYYVVEAVPENKYKKIWVVSAYINKSSAVTQVPNKSGSYLASPTSADNSIPNSSEDVKSSDVKDRILADESDFRQSLKLNPVIAEGQLDFLDSRRAFITKRELKEAHRVTAAMVDVMMRRSEILPEDKVNKVLTKNGSYDISVENTTICLRTLAYNEFIDKVQEEIGRPLTQMESFLVSQKLYDIATDPQCLYCYVSLDRKAYNDMLLRYVQDRDSVIAKYNNSDKSLKTVEELYKDFLHGRKATDPMRKRFDSWLKYADDGTQLLSLADIATEARQSEIAMKGGSLAEQLTDARRYAQSASWAKIQKNYVAYKDEILKLGDRVVSNLNKHYGLRWYSFSDYSPAFIVENMQQITDAAIRGLKGLSYTKDTDFARIFAPSGMNINVSVFVNTDKNGNFYIDEKQSAKLEEAIELRKQYPNVCIVATVTSDEALRWAGEQEWTDVIIPFHIVRTGTDVAEYYKWLNYTSESADTIKDKNLWDAYLDSLNLKSDNARKKVSKNIYPNEHNNDKDTYLNLCQSRGLTPRFVRFAGESWYMKLVNETRLSAAELTKLKPVFNLEAAMESFEKFIDKGGYEGGWYKADVDVDAEARAVADDVLAGKKANEVDYGRQDGFTPESVIASRKNNRSHGTKSSRKFSLDWIDFAEEQERERSAVSELTELKKINEELRAQIRHPGVKHIVSQLGVQKVARHLKSEYMSKVNIHKLSGELGDFYTLIANGDGISWDSLQIHIERIADMILGESKYKKPDISDYAKDVLRDIRSVKIKLNDEQKSEVASEYGSYNEFRKKTMGTLVLSNEGMSLDERWGELSKAYPRLFPEDTADTDQPRVLMEKVAALRETYEDMNGMDLESARDMLMTEIYEQYFEVPETKYISEEYKLKYARAKAEFGEKIREAKADFKKQKDEAYRKAKAEYGEILKGIREEEAEAILQAKARYNLRAEKMADTRVREKKRANVIKQVKRLDKLLRTPGKGAPSAGTNKYEQKYVHLTNIPESLKRTVIDFCSVFIEHDAGVFSGYKKNDSVTVREKKIEALQKQYKLLKQTDVYLKESVVEGMAEKLDKVAEIMAERRLSQLTAEELDTVIEITDHLITVINNQVEMWVDGKKHKVEGLGSSAVDQLTAKGQYKHLALPGHDFVKGWGVNNMKPVYFFERVGGVLEKLFLEMQNKGQRDYARNINAAAAFMDETSKKFAYEKWTDEDPLTIKTTQGHTLKLTKSQAMHIWATAKREAIAGKDSRHIMQGGIVFEDEIEADVVVEEKDAIDDNTWKAKIDKDTGGTIKKKFTKQVWKYKKSDGSAHRISLDDLDKISEYLTDEQKKFVDTMIGYLTNDMAALGNEVSMELYGIKRFNEKYYIPFNSAKNFIYRSMGEQGEAMLRSESFTKETTYGANNPLVVGDFLDVVAGHIERMAMYNSMVLPLENFSKIWNFKTFVAEGDDSSSTVSVRSAMETAFGKSYVSYVDTLLKDINGGINADSREKSIGRLLSNFKKTAVLGSASVVIQQPSAIVRAFAEIDPSYFVSTTFAGRKKAWEKALKYSSTALLKDIGGFDTVSGRGTVDWLTKTEYKGKDKVIAFFKDSQYRDDIIAWGPGFADKVTWAHIWAACEREVAHDNKGLQGEELYKKTGERFDEVINKTQVYDSVLTRSAHMRSKSQAMQVVTSFMSEPTTQANMIASAMFNAKNGKKGKATRQIASVVAAQLFNAMLVSIIYAARDDDEEKTPIEKYLAEVTENFLGSLNPLTMIPLFKDVWSLLEGYDVERSDMAVYADIIDAFKSINSSKKTTGQKITGIIGSIGNALGLPLKNLIREGYAVKNVVKSVGDISDTTEKGILYALEESAFPVLQTFKVWKPTTKEEKLYAAFSEGDKKMYNRIASQYTSGGKIKSDLKKQIGERFVEGEINETTATNQFRKLGLTENEAYYEVRSLKEPLPEEESEDKNADFFDFDSMQTVQSDADTESSEAKGDYDWLENALSTGGRADIQTEINDLKGRGVSEDDINSKIKSWIKENDSSVTAEAERYKMGNLNSFESTVRSVASKYGVDESSVAGAIRSAAGDKSKAIEGTIYAYGDLHVSIGSVNTAQTNLIASSIITAKTESYIAEGYTRAEAQKKAKQSLRSSLTSEWKSVYLSADSTERARIRQQLYATGAYDNLNHLDEILAGWRKNG